MNDFPDRELTVLPLIGCGSLFLVLLFLCLLPFFLVEVMNEAMSKLHLTPAQAFAALVGIFVGSLFNIPVHRLERTGEQWVDTIAVYGLWGWTPTRLRRVRSDTIIAVNVGGCVVPMLLVAMQIVHLLVVGGWPWIALFFVVGTNIAACYKVARPMPGVGIVMPGFVSPLVAVGLTWLLLPGGEYELLRAPVAFCGGVLGPIVGADLLHIKDIHKVSAGVVSIGGAGTFDGIVLSGVLAAVLA
ncbi:MAG: hypothetical protein KatS3mg105_1439 [Gemmatales bacterium]|nr:MAG: hypothetical protein KatS3mg105_1439 [Gemmatales bacterium]